MCWETQQNRLHTPRAYRKTHISTIFASVSPNLLSNISFKFEIQPPYRGARLRSHTAAPHSDLADAYVTHSRARRRWQRRSHKTPSQKNGLLHLARFNSCMHPPQKTYCKINYLTHYATLLMLLSPGQWHYVLSMERGEGGHEGLSE